VLIVPLAFMDSALGFVFGFWFFSFLIFDGTRIWTQCVQFPGQVLYHLSQASSFFRWYLVMFPKLVPNSSAFRIAGTTLVCQTFSLAFFS
jgi:hypothetical protein